MAPLVRTGRYFLIWQMCVPDGAFDGAFDVWRARASGLCLNGNQTPTPTSSRSRGGAHRRSPQAVAYGGARGGSTCGGAPGKRASGLCSQGKHATSRASHTTSSRARAARMGGRPRRHGLRRHLAAFRRVTSKGRKQTSPTSSRSGARRFKASDPTRLEFQHTLPQAAARRGPDAKFAENILFYR